MASNFAQQHVGGGGGVRGPAISSLLASSTSSFVGRPPLSGAGRARFLDHLHTGAGSASQSGSNTPRGQQPLQSEPSPPADPSLLAAWTAQAEARARKIHAATQGSASGSAGSSFASSTQPPASQHHQLESFDSFLASRVDGDGGGDSSRISAISSLPPSITVSPARDQSLSTHATSSFISSSSFSSSASIAAAHGASSAAPVSHSNREFHASDDHSTRSTPAARLGSPGSATHDRALAEHESTREKMELQLARHKAFLAKLNNPDATIDLPMEATTTQHVPATAAAGGAATASAPQPYMNTNASALLSGAPPSWRPSQRSGASVASSHYRDEDARSAQVSASPSAAQSQHTSPMHSRQHTQQYSPHHDSMQAAAAAAAAGGYHSRNRSRENASAAMSLSDTPRSTNSFGYDEFPLSENVFVLTEKQPRSSNGGGHPHHASHPSNRGHSSLGLASASTSARASQATSPTNDPDRSRRHSRNGSRDFDDHTQEEESASSPASQRSASHHHHRRTGSGSLAPNSYASFHPNHTNGGNGSSNGSSHHPQAQSGEHRKVVAWKSDVEAYVQELEQKASRGHPYHHQQRQRFTVPVAAAVPMSRTSSVLPLSPDSPGHGPSSLNTSSLSQHYLPAEAVRAAQSDGGEFNLSALARTGSSSSAGRSSGYGSKRSTMAGGSALLADQYDFGDHVASPPAARHFEEQVRDHTPTPSPLGRPREHDEPEDEEEAEAGEEEEKRLQQSSSEHRGEYQQPRDDSDYRPPTRQEPHQHQPQHQQEQQQQQPPAASHPRPRPSQLETSLSTLNPRASSTSPVRSPAYMTATKSFRGKVHGVLSPNVHQEKERPTNATTTAQNGFDHEKKLRTATSQKKKQTQQSLQQLPSIALASKKFIASHPSAELTAPDLHDPDLAQPTNTRLTQQVQADQYHPSRHTAAATTAAMTIGAGAPLKNGWTPADSAAAATRKRAAARLAATVEVPVLSVVAGGAPKVVGRSGLPGVASRATGHAHAKAEAMATKSPQVEVEEEGRDEEEDIHTQHQPQYSHHEEEKEQSPIDVDHDDDARLDEELRRAEADLAGEVQQVYAGAATSSPSDRRAPPLPRAPIVRHPSAHPVSLLGSYSDPRDGAAAGECDDGDAADIEATVVEAELTSLNDALVRKLRDEIATLRADSGYLDLFDAYEHTISALQRQNATLRVKAQRAELPDELLKAIRSPQHRARRGDADDALSTVDEPPVKLSHLRVLDASYRKLVLEHNALQAAYALLQKQARRFTLQSKQSTVLTARVHEHASQLAKKERESAQLEKELEAAREREAELKALVMDLTTQAATDSQAKDKAQELAAKWKKEVDTLQTAMFALKSDRVLGQVGRAKSGPGASTTPTTIRRTGASGTGRFFDGHSELDAIETLFLEGRKADMPPNLIALTNRKGVDLCHRMRTQVELLDREKRETQENEKALLMLVIKMQEKAKP